MRLLLLFVVACSSPPPGDSRALDRCEQALTSDIQSVSRVCGAAYAEPACRAAMRRDPDDRAAIARACAAAYCPSFEPPRPFLCDADLDEMTDDQVAQHWAAIRELALIRDHGDRGGRLSGVLAAYEDTYVVARSIPMDLPGQTPEVEPASLDVTIEVAPDGYVLWIHHEGSEQRHDVARDATTEQIAALLPPGGEEARAVIAADRETSHAFFLVVVEALRSAGYTRYAINVNPAEPPR